VSDDERRALVCVGKLKSRKLRHCSCDTVNSRFRKKSDSKSEKKDKETGACRQKERRSHVSLCVPSAARPR
jgi:hypothetical protein